MEMSLNGYYGAARGKSKQSASRLASTSGLREDYEQPQPNLKWIETNKKYLYPAGQPNRPQSIVFLELLANGFQENNSLESVIINSWGVAGGGPRRGKTAPRPRPRL
jgi:hypothetical protein